MSSTTVLASETAPSAERPEYPIGVPTKFSPSGEVQRYRGNTTVCHLPPDSSLLPGLDTIYDALGSHPTLGSRIHLLPKASWHMTVLDGVREHECEPGMWPEGKAKPPLDKCTEDFTPLLRQLGMQLASEGLGPPYRMKVRSFDRATGGVALEVEGATVQEEQRMRRLRDRMADTLGIRAPNHYTYAFHVSIAYLLRHVDGSDREELTRLLASLLPAVLGHKFELGAVEFCTFEDMHAFPRLFYLGEHKEAN